MEIVSDSSVMKDSQRLPGAHFAAGTLEYWLVDARDERLLHFQIWTRGHDKFEDRSGSHDWQRSGVLRRSLQLSVEIDADGWPEFRLASSETQ